MFVVCTAIQGRIILSSLLKAYENYMNIWSLKVLISRFSAMNFLALPDFRLQ